MKNAWASPISCDGTVMAMFDVGVQVTEIMPPGCGTVEDAVTASAVQTFAAPFAAVMAKAVFDPGAVIVGAARIVTGNGTRQTAAVFAVMTWHVPTAAVAAGSFNW